MKRIFRTHYRDYQLNQPTKNKMDESEGMCRTDASNYDSCWGRICNPSRGHVLKDILRGLLVLIILAIVVTVIFLLCYFLINDIEKKEDEAIDNLVKEFSSGGESLTPEPEISIKDKNHKPLSDAEIYDSGPLRGDLGKEKDRLQKEEFKQIELSSPGSSSEGENRIPEVQETTQDIPEVRIPSADDPVVVSPHGFIPVRGSAQGNNAGLLEFNFNPEQDGQMFDNFSDFVVAESGADCEPLRLPLCSTSMPWGLTAFPNWVNNNNMNELQQSLKYFQSTIIGAKCSLRAIEYSCAILEPACGPDGIPLPPCKSFCEDISRSCSEYITSENKHSIALQCDRFPDSKNPNVCVDISKGTPSDEDYPRDSFDEVLGREDPTPAILPETTADDEAKILEIEITDPPRDVPRIEKNGQVTRPMPREEPPKTEIVSEETVNGTTTELPVFICDHTKFLCEDGSDCLSQDAVCDGAQNCLDGSDEANCTAAPAAESDTPNTQEDLPIVQIFENDSPSLPKTSRRPSLSEMLSGSSLVAVPEPVTEPPPQKPELKLRFLSNSPSESSTPRPELKLRFSSDSTVEPPTPRPELKLRFSSDSTLKPIRGKSIESSPKRLNRNSLDQFSTTPKPTILIETDNHPNSNKLSLASLLSTSLAPAQRHQVIGAHSQNEPTFANQELDFSAPSSRKSLSDLLASSSFSSTVTKEVFGDDCPELQCLDGTCISIRQLTDGVEDCPDGADEQ